MQKHDSLILAIVWPIGCGKWTASSYLERRYGAKTFKCSGPLRKILDILNIPVSRTSMQELSRLIRESYGQESIARIAKAEVENSGSRISIIDGVRRLEDIGPFRELSNFFLIYVDADVRVRYGRIVQRAENSGDAEKSYEAFLEEEQWETEVSIQSLEPISHFHVRNESTESEFTGEIDRIIEELLA